MIHVVVTNRKWYENLPERLATITKHEFVLINQKADLTLERLKAIQPGYVFFPHWSYLVPSEIYENFECVIFHMTDVPFGRGGSPLQNLISRGIYETKMSALRCQSGVDAGPVYMKKTFSLYGTAEEIYMRASKAIEEMIAAIIEDEPAPVEQKGEIVYLERRKPEEGNIANLTELEQVFDYIRMLDADGYPKAFLETEHFRLEFERASLRHNSLFADVKITKKKGIHE